MGGRYGGRMASVETQILLFSRFFTSMHDLPEGELKLADNFFKRIAGMRPVLGFGWVAGMVGGSHQSKNAD